MPFAWDRYRVFINGFDGHGLLGVSARAGLNDMGDDRNGEGTPFALARGMVVHRIIEQHAAHEGDRVALVDADDTISYRLLNARANVLARALRCAGLRRGGHALIAGEAGTDLVVALLSVLKSGASYTWCAGADTPAGHPVISVASQVGRAPDEYLLVTPVLEPGPLNSSPNLPVLSRGTDLACLISPFDEASSQLSHADIVARRGTGPSTSMHPHDDRTAVALWVALMDGRPVTIAGRPAAAA